MSLSRPTISAFAVALILAAKWLPAQVVRLPVVMPPNESHPGQLVSHPDSSVELPPAESDGTPQLDLPPDARPGVFQKLIFNSTWLAAGGGDDFGKTELDLRTVLAFPCPTRDSPLLITPGFGVHYLDGPVGIDIPSRLYDAYTQFRWMHRLRPRLGIDLAVTPGWYSDYETPSGSALRITGHGVAAFDWTPTAKLILGVAYLDREDVGLLPIGGLIWTPHPDIKFELAAPRPRIARRLYWSGGFDDEVQDWAYVAGEFGGGTWAIRHLSGADDEITYRDFRVLLGIERKAVGRPGYRLELGYVFGRKLELDSPTPDIYPSDTVMLRVGATY